METTLNIIALILVPFTIFLLNLMVVKPYAEGMPKWIRIIGLIPPFGIIIGLILSFMVLIFYIVDSIKEITNYGKTDS